MPPFLLSRRACLGQWAALAGSALCASEALAQLDSGARKRQVTIDLSLEPESLDPTTAASASVGEVLYACDDREGAALAYHAALRVHPHMGAARERLAEIRRGP